MSEIFTNLLNVLGRAWWIEISTESPLCTYYFGPFSSDSEAEQAKSGYIEDLEREGARSIRVQIKRCKPEHLTIDHEVGNGRNPRSASPVFS
jgi:hypothetical protein